MTADMKKEVLAFLELEIEKAVENAGKTDEASKFVMTGHSQAGDKYHAQNAADLAQAYVKRLQRLKMEIQEADDKPVGEIKPASYVEIEYDDSSLLNFFLVEHAVSLTRFLFISKTSPLGTSVVGKKAGDTFSYELKEGGSPRKFSGKIIKIE